MNAFALWRLLTEKCRELGRVMDRNTERIFRLLDVNEGNGLTTVDSADKITGYQRQFFRQAREKLGIDAVYFLRDAEGVARIPTIYFSILDAYRPQEIAELHRLAWNMGEAPLLFVVTPDSLLIYNNYDFPKEKEGQLDFEAGLIEVVKLAADLETQRKAIQNYHRTLFESGEYWRRSKVRFDYKTHVYNTLIHNLKVVRRQLIQRIQARGASKAEKDIAAIVHGLLSRSILIKYLEERRDALNRSVFPEGFYGTFLEGASSYADVLCSKSATYSLFECLREKFNGDMLPLIEGEHETITEEDLSLLRDFLLGRFDMQNRQLTLWRLYSFDIIPIQMLSSIYEMFFHLSDKEDEKGTYYTPLHLVDMLLDEVYPWEGNFEPVRVLDPACGSGIFLVEIYRRMVCRWMKENPGSMVTNEQLRILLEENIYGVDLNEEAVRVAAFSLCLAVCDFLEPRNIWEQLRFPKLVNRNLVISDFFEESAFGQEKFDLIIGNPPWQSRLTENARKYLKIHGKIVGDKQIAQAFSWKCADLCKETGIICLVMPSKGFLFNRSLKNIEYRRSFFHENTVSVVINLSLYRKFLFTHGSGPAAAVVYRPIEPEEKASIFYCTPKPLYTMEDLRRFSIEPNDISRIPLNMIQDDRIWKIAMWGGPRDLGLVSKWRASFESMKRFLEENGMISAEGYKLGRRTKECGDFWGYPVITAKCIEAFYQEEEGLPKADFTNFECVVSTKRKIFEPPHLIMRQSHREARFLAAVLDYKAVFNHSLLGIYGDSDRLKYLCLIINSKVFTYYHLMTNRKWMVERDELEAGDIWETPIPRPSLQQLEQAVAIFDRIKAHKDSGVDFEGFVASVYGLYEYEAGLVEDAIDYIYSYYHGHEKSKAFSKPQESDFTCYYNTFTEILNNSFGQDIVRGGNFYVGDAPLAVLSVAMGDSNADDIVFHTESRNVEAVLMELDDKMSEESGNIFIKRNVRVYKRNAVYIIKPMQAKYWNFSSACRDADDVFSDIMKAWRCMDERHQ